MKDSETLSRLIYRAFVLAQPGIVDGLEARVAFPVALEFYAQTRIRELIDDGKLELVPDSDAAPAATEEPLPDEPTPESADTHTHTHTQPGPLRAKDLRPEPSPAKDRVRSAKSTRI